MSYLFAKRWALTLAELHVSVLTSFNLMINEALTKPYHDLIENLLQIDFRYHNKWLFQKKILKSQFILEFFLYV